ncbi:LytTR family transcriptional regulator DNA-binding domain-containing protein [Runella aurantiaca]|uniref:LytTR family transcriptional regulator n=1 Tax=Runella aurantiaca TaxID=2282308 RepID=A0A369IC99_9BACT|nr:LytTR family transcriptional regulator DNA-binding domain-containing protein [Runella aurantiaca]RDB04276.1 LytTR family transcriptional regulator [Runella aurantiaca]
MTATVGLAVGESVVHLPRFQTKRGERAIDLKQIVYLSAQSNYTIFHLITGEEVLTTLSLSSYASLLETRGFIRIHKSSLLNRHYLGKCRLIRSGELMLPNGKVIEVARRKRSSLKKIANENDAK